MYEKFFRRNIFHYDCIILRTCNGIFNTIFDTISQACFLILFELGLARIKRKSNYLARVHLYFQGIEILVHCRMLNNSSYKTDTITMPHTIIQNPTYGARQRHRIPEHLLSRMFFVSHKRRILNVFLISGKLSVHRHHLTALNSAHT